MKKNVKITVRFTENSFIQIQDISNKMKLSIPEYIRKSVSCMIEKEVISNSKGFEKKDKVKISRAEKLSIYSSVMCDLILREQITKEKVIELKARVKTMIDDKWDYADE